MKEEPVSKRTRSQKEREIVEKYKRLKKNKKIQVDSSSSDDDNECDRVTDSVDVSEDVNEVCDATSSDSESKDGCNPSKPIRVGWSDDEEESSLASKEMREDVTSVDGNGSNDVHEKEEEERETDDDDSFWRTPRRNKGKAKLSTKRKMQKCCGLNNDDVERIFLKTILKMKEATSEDSSSTSSEVWGVGMSQLLSDEESPSAEKLEDDGLAEIWEEMAFAQQLCKMEVTDSNRVENEVASSHEVGNAASRCERGVHDRTDLILNEEEGLYCQYCTFVVPIRRIDTVDFATSPSRRSEWREYNNVNPSMFDDLLTCDSDFDFHSGCNPCFHARGTVWELVPDDVRKKMYAHQCEGFEFIWRNLAGGIDLKELKNSTSKDGGNGCIISHAPGTGKTGLSIVFVKSYMKLLPSCRPVIIAPRSMLLTWEEEFHSWGVDIPFHNLNKPELSGKEGKEAVALVRQVKGGGGRVKLIRYAKVYSWRKGMGVLGLSYRLFDKLVSEGDELSGILLSLPGLFVFDEGHTPRNDDSSMYWSLRKIKTRRRVLLSGTPFQNNFQELQNTLSLVRAEFGEVKYTMKKRGRKRNGAKYASHIRSIGRGANPSDDEKLRELKKKIAPFVHIHKGTVLQERLPGLRCSVIVLQPDDFQKSLYKGVDKGKSFVELNYLVSLISVHPSLFPTHLFESCKIDTAELERIKLDPMAGIKTKFLVNLLRLTNEKVIVFSQYLEPLKLIVKQLKHWTKWSEGQEVLYMDGKQDLGKRQSSMNVLNDPSSQARILLASTKACSEGISLVGASRVVLLDVEWNPSVERQAISRAYRLGQKKVVHVYHLITSLEGDKLRKQARKVRWSNIVFFSSDGGNCNKTTASEPFEDRILDELDRRDIGIDCIFPQSKESELIETFGGVLKDRS